ncbi:MAG: DEAD/DEAH box helicase [Acidimicrobiales bacterium]
MKRTPTFAELGVDAKLVEALLADGIEQPFEVQTLTIPDAIAGRDVCGKAKTGSGKTLAFGLPLLMATPAARSRHPASLVLEPTRELALQVTEVLARLGEAITRRVGAVYGGTDLDEQVRMVNRGLDVVVATPGRLIDLVDRRAIALSEISTLVVDEADRMADMGFMPQVEWLLRHITGPHQTLLFSATLDATVDRLVKRYLTNPVFHETHSDQVTVDEMEHHFFRIHQLDKAKVVAAIARGAGKTLVFVRTKRGADRLTSALHEERVRAAAIHGDLRQVARERALADFAKGKLQALVATDVAARGLDIEGVDIVVHYDPPEDQKAYLHRSGRTARAGEAGVVVTLLLWDQELPAERLQRRLGLSVPIIEVFSNDTRLSNLVALLPEDATELIP